MPHRLPALVIGAGGGGRCYNTIIQRPCSKPHLSSITSVLHTFINIHDNSSLNSSSPLAPSVEFQISSEYQNQYSGARVTAGTVH